MRPLCLIVLLIGCGRVNFDPLGGGGVGDGGAGDGTFVGDGLPTGDGALGDSGGNAAGDMCTAGVPISVGQTLSNQSIAGAANDYGGTPCGNGPEVVYTLQHAATATRSFTVTAGFTGGMWMSTMCPPSAAGASCNVFGGSTPASVMTTFPAGTVYLVVDKTGGATTTFDVSIQ